MTPHRGSGWHDKLEFALVLLLFLVVLLPQISLTAVGLEQLLRPAWGVSSSCFAQHGLLQKIQVYWDVVHSDVLKLVNETTNCGGGSVLELLHEQTYFNVRQRQYELLIKISWISHVNQRPEHLNSPYDASVVANLLR